MARKASNFKVGLFVTLGGLMLVVLIVWLGASKYFQKTLTYVTYFNESVQGLQKDSSVKYLGVDIGRVDKIRVAPDYKLIEVVMKIDFQGDLSDVVAQLKAAGITGIVFIELDRREPGEPDQSPKLDFTTEYPVLPSRPSQLTQIFATVGEVVEMIRKVDFRGISDQLKSSVALTEVLIKDIDSLVQQADIKGISDQVKSTLKAGEELLGGKRMTAILANLESASANLKSATGRTERMLAEGKLDAVLAEARATMIQARQLAAALKEQVSGLELTETAGKTSRLVDGLERRSQTITQEIKSTSENLRRVSETLQLLLDRLSASPSDLIFSQPPPPRRAQ
jgi:phospholipid/cholesterol/gamma-HCH transport system substrate-binding protein